MAGDWIKMRADLTTDPAVFSIAEKLGIDELHVVGCLFCFWSWADKHSVDGHVDGATSRVIDKVSQAVGFADALASVGWLVLSESGADLPNFERHNGESAKERGLKNARQARWRAKKDAHVDETPSTKASTREEKRREELIQDPPASRAPPAEAGQAKAARGLKRCPDSFAITDDLREFIRDEGIKADVSAELARFRDHTFRTARSDWPATFRNWLREADARIKPVNGAHAARQAEAAKWIRGTSLDRSQQPDYFDAIPIEIR